MLDYLDVATARSRPGLRLVLTAGVPGPWGESAKYVFHVKGIPFAPVRQDGGLANDALRDWTGRDNAPQAVFEDEPARCGWAEIVLLAERLAPEPALIPHRAEDRAAMFGLSHEICGESGFGWCRRLMILAPILAAATDDAPAPEPVERLGAKYGYRAAEAEAAPARVASILTLLTDRLREQRRGGSRYLVGDTLSAADLHWAASAAMLEPLPDDLCPMPRGIRAGYELPTPVAGLTPDPILLEHRDFVYAEHLSLPLDF